MNKLSVKILSICLCAAFVLCAGGAGTTTGGKNDGTAKTAVTTTKAEGAKEISKDETVYVFAAADGSVKKIIVKDWIKNALYSNSITDRSELSDIETVKGDAEYTLYGDNRTVWNAEGEDIYYQGNIEKELPVELKVSYTLDGKPISAKKLAGKSGALTIRFDYENRLYEMAEIDGKKEKIYIPFALMTGMLLDSDTFRNVEVSNGKLLNDGDHTAVIGIAFPGLQENLGIDKDTIEIPDYVEIRADVTDFELGMTVTVATNGIFTNLDAEKIDSADALTGSLDELADGMQQLLDGSSALYDGLCTLLEKSEDLVDGVDALADGAKALADGTDSADDGAGRLKAGAWALSDGLNTLKNNNDALNGGARQVFETLLSTAEQQITAAGISVPTLTIGNYAQVLESVIESLDETSVYEQALAQVTAAVEENRPLIVEQVTAAVREQVEAKVTSGVKEKVSAGVTAAVREQVSEQVIFEVTDGMSKEAYEDAVSAGTISDEIQAAVTAAIEAQMQTDDIKALIDAKITAQMESDETKATIAENIEAQMQSDDVQQTILDNVELQVTKAIADNMASDEVQSKLAAASEGAKSIIALKTSLDSYNAFYLGLLSYTDGVAAAADGAADLASGASDLKDGTGQLRSGAETLYDGVLQMKQGVPALLDGVEQLKDGAMQLSDGLKQFDEEGIQKIVDLFDGDLDSLLERVRATLDVSKNYQNFSGISKAMAGQVKFIYRTDEIK